MKKNILRLCVLFAVFTILAPCLFAQDRVKIVTTKGGEIVFPVRLIEKSPHIPLREILNISKDLPPGWKAEWDETFGILRLTGEKSAYSLFLDKKTLLINDEVRQVKEPIKKQDGGIFVPVSSLEVLKDLFREISILDAAEIKPAPIAPPPSASPVPEKIPSAQVPYPASSQPVSSGSFRIMIDPAAESLKWEKPPQSTMPLPEQEGVTREIALGIKRILEQEKSVEVFISAQKDDSLSLEQRIERINTSGADLLVSLRLDASRFENLEGVDIYVCSEALDPEAANKKPGDKKGVLPLTLAYLPYQRESLALADSMLLELSNSLSCRVGPITPAPLYLQKRTAKPSVLISCGYVSNPREAALLAKDTYLETLSRALADGILRYKKHSGY
jgi:N-acetylmuramoyl-L-alanine amidase